jgi:ribonuclease HI
MPMIEFYTDGSSKIAKDGTYIGGWAVYMPGTEDPIICGGEVGNATNQRMELMALLKGCNKAEQYHQAHPNEKIFINSDSKYALNCALEWSKKWEQNGWKRQGDKEIINLELIKEIYYYYTKFVPEYLNFRWVKGHSVVDGNNIVDEAAQKTAETLRKKYDSGDPMIFSPSENNVF